MLRLGFETTSYSEHFLPYSWVTHGHIVSIISLDTLAIRIWLGDDSWSRFSFCTIPLLTSILTHWLPPSRGLTTSFSPHMPTTDWYNLFLSALQDRWIPASSSPAQPTPWTSGAAPYGPLPGRFLQPPSYSDGFFHFQLRQGHLHQPSRAFL